MLKDIRLYPMDPSVSDFVKTNQHCIEDNTFNTILLERLFRITSVESFLTSDAVNPSSKKAFRRSVQNVAMSLKPRVFVTQGTSEPITNVVNTGHPFDACPHHCLQFIIKPTGSVELLTVLQDVRKHNGPKSFV